MDIGQRIRSYRKLQGLSTVKLASKAGVSQSYLTQVENGEKSPSVNILKAVAEALDLTLGQLLTDEDEITAKFGAYSKLPERYKEIIDTPESRPYLETAWFQHVHRFPVEFSTGMFVNSFLFMQAKYEADPKLRRYYEDLANTLDGVNRKMFELITDKDKMAEMLMDID